MPPLSPWTLFTRLWWHIYYGHQHRKSSKVFYMPYVWFVKIWQYLVDIQVFEYLESEGVKKSTYWENHLKLHLADAFIQSNLQCIQVIYFLSVHVFPGNRIHNLCAANAMLYHWATGKLYKWCSLQCILSKIKFWHNYRKKCNKYLHVTLLMS